MKKILIFGVFTWQIILCVTVFGQSQFNSNDFNSRLLWKDGYTLTWADFIVTMDSNRKGQSISKWCDIYIVFSFSSDKSLPVVVKLESVLYKTRSFQDTTYLNRIGSRKLTDYILEYETMQFNLAELYTRKLRQYVKSKIKKYNNKSAKYVFNDISNRAKKVNGELISKQNEYSNLLNVFYSKDIKVISDSNLNKIENQIKTWDFDINQELKSLNEYGFSEIDFYVKKNNWNNKR